VGDLAAGQHDGAALHRGQGALVDGRAIGSALVARVP
jgi:hypothetical protein